MNKQIYDLNNKIIVLTTKGNTILPAGDYVFKLTDELIDDNFVACIENNFITIREANMDEKQFWFDNYNENDSWGVGLIDG